MFADLPPHYLFPPPHPGEIWELNLPCDSAFLSENRYVTIIREPQPQAPKILSGMLLSWEVEYLSDVDILIPLHISGLDRDILAETWNVRSFSIDLLAQRVGNRLSRKLYDLLLSIGDRQWGISTEMPSVRSIRALELEIASRSNLEFHQREKIWFNSLNPSPILDTKSLILIDQTISVEREFIDLAQIRTSLSEWFQQIIEPEWQEPNNLGLRVPIATRSIADDDIVETIEQINSIDDEVRRRQLIRKLGDVANGCQDAIQTLIKLISNTQDQETLWVAVDSLRQIDPEHPQVGIRRSRSIKLDLSVALDFVVSVVPRYCDRTNHPNFQRFAIFLQVHPDRGSDAYLPANLKLVVRDEIGNVLAEVIARSSDRCIQLKLSGTQTEVFSVCLEVDGIKSISDFII
jgi:Protein of unknown function (DUF1822)